MANVDGENNHALDSLPEPRQAYDLSHHVVDFPLELQYRELVAIQFGSFALSRSPLMSRQVAKRSIKYLWSITLDLLPYDGPPRLPQITAHDIAYAISYLGSLIKRGKGVARLLAIADFDPLTRTYPEDDISFLCSNPSPNLADDTISAEDGPFCHPAIGMIICRMLTFDSKGDICLSPTYFYPKMPKAVIIFVCGLIRFALDEFNTGSYLKLSFTEWNQEYSWSLFGELWDSAEEIQGGTYLDGVQRSLAEQLRNSILRSRHPILDTPPRGPLFPWDRPNVPDEPDNSSPGHDTDATLVN